MLGGLLAFGCGESEPARDAGAGGQNPLGPLPDEVPAQSPEGIRYYVDRTEVTRGAYAEWLATDPPVTLQPTECEDNDDYTPTCDWPPEGLESHPVVCVDWCDAYAYCKAVGKRLCGRIGGGANSYQTYQDPAMDQWFNACSQQGANEYPYGSPFDPHRCNGALHGRDATAPVASMAGCRADGGEWDMSGNVGEWKDACETNTQSTAFNYCRLGGGSFRAGELRHLTCVSPGQDAYRTGHWDSIGFRCCRDAEPSDMGTGGAGGVGGGGQADACNECLASSCGAQDAACLANEECILMFDCMARCFDQDCVTACETSSPAGVTNYQGSTTCFSESCDTAC